MGCTSGCGWSLRPRSSHVSWPLPSSASPCAGVLSVVAPPLQSGITRVIRDRPVLRPPLIAWVQLGACCRVRRVRGAYRRLVACASDVGGAGHQGVAAAPDVSAVPGAGWSDRCVPGRWAHRGHRRRPRERSDHAARRPGQPRRRRQRRTLLQRFRRAFGDRRPAVRASAAGAASRGRWPAS